MQVLQAEQISFFFQRVPYDIQVVCDAITKRTKAGKRFSILAVAEGAISKEDAAMSKKELKERRKAALFIHL